MSKNKSRVYFDSCVFLDIHWQTNDRIADISRIEADARDGKVRIITSTMAIAEVAKVSQNPTPEDVRQIDRYFRNKFISIVPLDPKIARMAAKLVRDHPIKPADAVHAATAIRNNCRCMYTYDEGENATSKRGLLMLDGKLGNPPLAIKRPSTYDYGGLFDV